MRRQTITRWTFLVLLLATGLGLACRPAWSPDSKRCLHLVKLANDRLGVGCYDVATEKSELLTVMPREAMVAPAWHPDGQHAVVLWAKEKAATLQVTTIDLRTKSALATVVIPVTGDVGEMFTPTLVHGPHLFVATDTIVRIDMATGEQRRAANEGTEELLLTPYGDGLAYFASHKHRRDRWQFGTLDPDTMVRTPRVTPPAQFPWEVLPMPAVSHDRRRLALPARRVGKPNDLALLVFAGDQLENTLVLGPHEQLDCASLQWLPDGVTLAAGLCRRTAETMTWSLYETTLSGSVTRETKVLATKVTSKDQRPWAMAFPLALAPDGSTAAASTAMLASAEPHQHGLWLVDLTSNRRTVTQVPFPKTPPEVMLRGSAHFAAAATAWVDGFALSTPDCLASAIDSDASRGLQALISGTCDLAMTTRAPNEQEQQAANDAGVTLREHRIAFDAVAVIVHADNPLRELTVEQLAKILGRQPLRAWAELGVTLATAGPLVAVGLNAATETGEFVRDRVLQRRSFARDMQLLKQSENVVELVRASPTAIGFVRAGHVGAGVRVVPLRAAEQTAATLPEPAVLAAGRYALARPVMLYSRHDAKPEVATFLQWLQSDAGLLATARAGLLVAPR